MRALAIAAAIALAAPAARADDGTVTPKSRSTALWLSIAPTAAGVGLLIAGGNSNDDGVMLVGGGLVLLGPTVGHWYAGKVASPGLLLRGVGGGLLIASAPDLICWKPSCTADQDTTWALAATGAALILGGTAWDIATAPSAADDWNRDHDMDLAITPTALRSPAGHVAPGLAVTGSF